MVEGSTASDADYGRDWRHLPPVIIGLVFFFLFPNVPLLTMSPVSVCLLFFNANYANPEAVQQKCRTTGYSSFHAPP